MPLTVRQLLAREDLRLRVVVEGDLERTVRWIHSSEMPDPSSYLQGDEVVLTAGIWHWAGAPASVFVGGLVAAGAGALGFGTTPLVRAVPDDVVEACAARRLTLFHVPDDVAFIAITAAFVEAYVHDHERPLLDSLARGEQLARALHGEDGIGGILRVLVRSRPGFSAVIDRRRGLIASSGGAAPPDDLVAALAARADVPGFRTYSVPGRAGETLLAVQGDGPPSVEERAAIDQVLAFLAIEVYRARAAIERERRFAAELLELVEAGEAQAAAVVARLRSLGLDAAAPLVVVACAGVDAVDPAEAVGLALEAQGVRAVVAPTAAGVVAIAQPAPALAALGAALHAALGPGSSVGLSAIAPDARALRVALVEARHACTFAGRRRDAGWASHDALASHALLIAVQDPATLRAFEQTLLAPLAAHDARRGTDLVDTLERFLGSGGHYRATAEALHVHVNTLRLRLARIEELTGRDLSTMEDRVDLWIALRARDAR
jgi:hypothetical protein